jgi:FlaG/FlaF family flagellin (archaellin)
MERCCTRRKASGVVGGRMVLAATVLVAAVLLAVVLAATVLAAAVLSAAALSVDTGNGSGGYADETRCDAVGGDGGYEGEWG